MILNKKVLDIVNENLAPGNGDVAIVDLGDEYVIFRDSQEVLAGALRLIVAKDGDYFFIIPSGFIASPQLGVSWEYVIEITDFGGNGKNVVSKILSNFVNESATVIFKTLAVGPTHAVGPYFVAEPKRLIWTLNEYSVHGMMLRPKGQGGYVF